MLYWYREDKTRNLEKDIELAIERYQQRFDDLPTIILVRPSEEEEFVPHRGSLNIKTDKYIGERYFGLL